MSLLRSSMRSTLVRFARTKQPLLLSRAPGIIGGVSFLVGTGMFGNKLMHCQVNRSKYGLMPSGKYGKLDKIIPLEEVRKHVTEDSLWVTYGGNVYDITGFLDEHPGGKEALLGAGGQDIEEFWNKVQIHYRKNALDVLAPYKIGELSEEDNDRITDITDPENTYYVRTTERQRSKQVKRAYWRGVWEFLDVVQVGATVPLFFCIRWTLRCIGFFGRYIGGWHLANLLASQLPVSVPGFQQHRAIASQVDGVKTRIAIVGGGISGVGCAYSLNKSGYDVTIYEAREVLGGNAQLASYPVNGQLITQDLSVLFWADEYYKNYVALLDALDVTAAKISATYLLHTNLDGKSQYYTPPGSPASQALNSLQFLERYQRDFDRFDRMVGLIRFTNNCFTLDSKPSFYKHNGIWPLFNPMNFIPLRAMAWLCGISDDFYDNVLRPFHGLNFSTLHIDGLPAVAMAVLDDVVPLTSTRMHGTWGPNTSKEVFSKASRGCEVRLNTRVRAVEFDASSGRPVVTDDQGKSEQFDRVVFACSAAFVDNMLKEQNWIEAKLLRGVDYHDNYVRPDWGDWLEAPVHTDASVLPELQRDIVKNEMAFIIDVDTTSESVSNVEYTHILGAWSPAAAAAGERGADMYVTQCLNPRKNIDPNKIIASISAPRAHPDMCVRNMMITQLLHLIQGRRGIYYCSNWATAGNGHDLSLVAGLVCANAIGAKYPFDNQAAEKDMNLMREFMGF